MSDFLYKKVSNDNSFSIIFILTVFISSSSFYNFFFLNRQIILLAQLLVVGLIVLLNVLNFIYFRRQLYIKNFSLGIGFILTGSLLAVFSAFFYHNQSPLITAFAQKGMLYYLFYFTLHMLKVSNNKIIQLITVTGIIYAIFYLIQYMVFPTVIFDVRQEMDRGTIRIFIPGSIFMYAAYFISLQNVIYKKSIKDIFLMVLFLTITVLTGTRNVMAMVGIVSTIGIIISKKVKFKPAVYFLFLACAMGIFFVFKDMFMAIIELSFKQTEGVEENIRVMAARFFLTTFMPHNFCYILGNGMPHGSAAYGMQVMAYAELYGYYLSDIGFIGEYVRYGAIFVAGVLICYFKWFSIKAELQHTFTKYLFFFYILAMFFGGGWANDASIVMLCCVFYILDTSNVNYLSKKIRYINTILEKQI